MSGANVTKLKKAGMPVDSLEAAQAWRLKHQNVAARKALPGAAVSTLVSADSEVVANSESHLAARTRREIAEANLAEMQESEERGALIRVEAVKAALAMAFASAREALLQIPSRIAPGLAAESDAAAIANALQVEIHQALEQLATAGATLSQPEPA